MEVNSVTVSYRRSRQPAPYESAEPSITFTATLAESEDHMTSARALMADAVQLVQERIGLAEAPKEAPIGIHVPPAHVGATKPFTPEEKAPDETPTDPNALPAHLDTGKAVRSQKAAELAEWLRTHHAVVGADYFDAQIARLPKADGEALRAELAPAEDVAPEADPVEVVDTPEDLSPAELRRLSWWLWDNRAHADGAPWRAEARRLPAENREALRVKMEAEAPPAEPVYDESGASSGVTASGPAEMTAEAGEADTSGDLAPVSDADLMAALRSAAQRITGAKVTDIVREFGVAQARALDADKRRALIARLAEEG